MKCTISFIDENTKSKWDKLNSSGYEEDKKTVLLLNRAFETIEKNCYSGTFIQKKKIPKYYTKKYGELPNLWKYNLSDSWRLVYFIVSSGGNRISIVVEWMNHKDYNKRFGYD